MDYTVSVTFVVKGLRDKGEVDDFAESLPDHLLDTFKDHTNIDPCVEITLKPTPKTKEG